MRRIPLVFAVFLAAAAHMTPPRALAQEPADASRDETRSRAGAWSWDAAARGPGADGPGANGPGAVRTGAVDAVRRDTPSGLPVPRFVSLKSGKTFCRIGPSFSHPVRLTYMRRGLPVVVVAETHDHWRKVRDRDGDECWVHRSKLSGAETALVVEDGLVVRARPSAGAPALARLGAGVVARVEEHRDGWSRVAADATRGWVPRAGLWGASESDAFAAAHN